MELPFPPSDYEARMPRFAEETGLCAEGKDAFGRKVQLTADTMKAWTEMHRESQTAGLRLLLLSGFRSVCRQTEIVQRKLSAGLPLEAILRVNAYPGFSEHHTGRAIDLGSPDCGHFSEAFEGTREFRWLQLHAARFGFFLSYPRNNSHGIIYEPWHWCLSKPGNRPGLEGR